MMRHGLRVTLMAVAGTCLVLLISQLAVFCEDLEESNPALRENLLPAQQGDPQAQVFVGYLYETGQGVQQNYPRAAQWYWKAAEQGNPTAQYQLGNMYHQGKGVSQNYSRAYMWLDLAAARGNLNAKEIRRIVAGKMTPAEIADAKRMVEEWRPNKK
jgi:uncharacterized protein